MEYLRFGRTGLKVSQLCLGTMSMGSSAWKGWVLNEDDSIPILRRALDLGITFFDMADWYSAGRNEEVVGQNLLRMSAREHLVLATKVYYPMSDDPNDRGLSAKHIATAIDRSLARMGTDYVDLYVIHAFDAGTPVEETMEALHDAVRARQGALPRRVYHVRLAVREDELRRGAERLDAVRQYAVPIQRALPRGGAGDVPLLPGPGHQRHDLQSPGARASSRATLLLRARPTTSTRNTTATTSIARLHAACARWLGAGA
jgi:aryl-alcohol dehydrogenase-like predicted oxidoreductase